MKYVRAEVLISSQMAYAQSTSLYTFASRASDAIAETISYFQALSTDFLLRVRSALPYLLFKFIVLLNIPVLYTV